MYFYLMMIVSMLTVGMQMYFRFTNPLLTETQLFLEFWPYYIFPCLLMVLLYAKIKEDEF